MKFNLELDNWTGSKGEIEVDTRNQSFTFNGEKYYLKKSKDEGGEEFYFIHTRDQKIGIVYKEGNKFEASDLNFSIFRVGDNPYIAAGKLISNIV